MMNNNRILARDGVTPSIYVSCVRTLQCDVNTRFIMMPAALLSADTYVTFDIHLSGHQVLMAAVYNFVFSLITDAVV